MYLGESLYNQRRKAMKRNATLFTGLCLVLAFVVWTTLVSTIDVKAIGPEGSSVGFSTLNGYIHDLTGVNMSLYQLTDWLGLVPIGTALGFAILGLIQWIKTKIKWKNSNYTISKRKRF